MLPARLAFSLLSPAGSRARLSVLIFHRVLPQPDPIFPGEVCAASFDAILGWLGQCCNVIPLDEAVKRLRQGNLPARAAAITFDDGYADNHGVALPILQRHGMAATFFIATGFLDGGRMWNDSVIESVRHCAQGSLDLSDVALPGAGDSRFDITSPEQQRQAIGAIIGRIKYAPMADRVALSEAVAQRAAVQLPTDQMLSTAQVRALRKAGMQIGAHTQHHPILARLDAVAARDEIARSKIALETMLGERVGLFAYPNGAPGTDYGADAVSAVRELGFDAAVSTSSGSADRHSDVFQLPRFTPWDRTRGRFCGRLAANLCRPGQTVKHSVTHAVTPTAAAGM